jgi:hypothetical protein
MVNDGTMMCIYRETRHGHNHERKKSLILSNSFKWEWQKKDYISITIRESRIKHSMTQYEELETEEFQKECRNLYLSHCRQEELSHVLRSD